MPSELEFRRNLEELKALRLQVNGAIIEEAKQDFTLPVEIEMSAIEEAPGQPSKPTPTPTLLKLPSPSNPLLDQQVTIVKPTKWIDCISRESRRVFVQDKWIVARIALPALRKQAGLSELLQ